MEKYEANEAVDEILSPDRYRADYDKLSEDLKAQCSWEEVYERLLDKEGHYLKLVEGLEGGGVFFGVDKEGNPLFADAGVEPIMKGKSYYDTRTAVYGEDYDPKKPHYGYEMFSSDDNYGHGDEMKQFEAHTEGLFTRSANGQEWRSVWLESGSDPVWGLYVRFYPYRGYVRVGGEDPSLEGGDRGVRRLLRIKKFA